MILFKLKFILIIGGLAIGALFSLLFFVTVFISDEETKTNLASNEEWETVNISDAVLAHQPMVEKYAKAYDVEDYVPMILAIIEVESGGETEDVMQSSESLGLPVNSLDTEDSIEQGVKYISELLDASEEKSVDDETVIQSYNFGAGFIDHVAEREGSYSFELAESFAKEQSDGEKTAYSHPIAEEQNGGWRYSYGNMFYVARINEYLEFTNSESNGDIANIEGSKFPEPDPSDYGGIHPEGECTYYADNRRKEIGTPLENTRLGDAGSWIPRAKASNMETGSEPKVGAVMVYDYCQLNVSCRYGHVAVVEKVNEDGSVEISEMNWEGHNVVSYRTVSESDAKQLKYIY